jgi:hypothetical protein
MTPGVRVTSPTAEEVQRVRVEECRQLNHDFQVVQSFQDHGPTNVICGRCGAEWSMTEEARRLVEEFVVATLRLATAYDEDIDQEFGRGDGSMLTDESQAVRKAAAELLCRDLIRQPAE